MGAYICSHGGVVRMRFSLEGLNVIVGVDLDGVCADIVAAYREVVSNLRGVTPNELPDPIDYNFSNWGFSEPLTDHEEFFVAMESGMARFMPPIAGAADAFARLRGHGVRIRVITGRLVRPNMARTAVDTILWAQREMLEYDDICFTTDKVGVLADIYVEDSPEIIRALESAGRQTIVYAQSYNASCTGSLGRATDWDAACDLILDFVKDQNNASDGTEATNAE